MSCPFTLPLHVSHCWVILNKNALKLEDRTCFKESDTRRVFTNSHQHYNYTLLAAEWIYELCFYEILHFGPLFICSCLRTMDDGLLRSDGWVVIHSRFMKCIRVERRACPREESALYAEVNLLRLGRFSTCHLCLDDGCWWERMDCKGASYCWLVAARLTSALSLLMSAMCWMRRRR